MGKLINAPVDEGWRLQNYPRINPGGVVNGTAYSTNIHLGTVVAIPAAVGDPVRVAVVVRLAAADQREPAG